MAGWLGGWMHDGWMDEVVKKILECRARYGHMRRLKLSGLFGSGDTMFIEELECVVPV